VAPEAIAVEVPVAANESARTTALHYRAAGERLLILAHGAGADQRHPFLVEIAGLLAARDIDVLTFNFLYTEARRRAPDRPPLLEACWRTVIARARAAWPTLPLAIGGKSMGGRIATQVAAGGVEGVRAVVLLGYPLHPPGKPAQLRVAHLPDVRLPMLFLQGARDPFGAPDELRPHLVALAPLPKLLVVDGGDHSFAVPKRSGRTAAEVRAGLADAIAGWLRSV
jgi:predicted alpha/beta-hydrolase family hydrolase